MPSDRRPSLTDHLSTGGCGPTTPPPLPPAAHSQPCGAPRPSRQPTTAPPHPTATTRRRPAHPGSLTCPHSTAPWRSISLTHQHIPESVRLQLPSRKALSGTHHRHPLQSPHPSSRPKPAVNAPTHPTLAAPPTPATHL